MLEKLEHVLIVERPDLVQVYGDTNSTLAGALAAAKLHIPIAHVEAGLRSYNRGMPEEINRTLTDQVSSLLLCPTCQAVDNLHKEGITRGVHLVGDVMYDCARFFVDIAESKLNPLADMQLHSGEFASMTCHRAENTDDLERLSAILRAANHLAGRIPVLFPVHPRTQSRLQHISAREFDRLKLVEPRSYLEMLVLLKHACLVLTDSGGLQKEAFFLGTPCVTTRDETEWVETVATGANVLAGAQAQRIASAIEQQLGLSKPLPDPGPWYGGGQAARRIASLIASSDRNKQAA
jgi:UDP-N-acetylglucosamine 2-epimerase